MKRIAMLLAVLIIAASLVACSGSSESRDVRTVRVNEKGELIVVFTDGTESNVGVVKGEDGKDGANGKDGADGEDGADGKDGKDGEQGPQGETGIIGPQGKDGRSVDSIKMASDGDLLVTYDNGDTEVIDIKGQILLFEGKCGDNAKWEIYNGGILYLNGSGATYDYEEGKTPWYSLVAMINAVCINTADGLTLGENVLFGIDESIITYEEIGEQKWIDMTDSAPIYSSADNQTEPIASLPLGTPISVLSEENGYAKITYNGAYAYLETKYTVNKSGSVVYDPLDITLKVTGTNGANLRTFPDATAASKNNIHTNVPLGSVLNCTGVSENGNWYRVTYDGKTLYVYSSGVEINS